MKCEVLIGQGSKRCSCCKNHRKYLYAMVSRDLKCEHKQTSASSHMDSHLITGGHHNITVEETQVLKISLPVEVDAPADSICNLQNKLNSCQAIPPGMYFITAEYLGFSGE